MSVSSARYVARYHAVGTLGNQRGLALIEVLVTVLIMAIGLLGLAGLQTRSLRFTQTSLQHAQAIHLAIEMADRMRSNPAGFTSYTGLGSNTSCLTSDPTKFCGPATVAAWDVYQWQQALADPKRLTNGEGKICQDVSPDDDTCDAGDANTPYAIKIWWNEMDRANTKASSTERKRFSLSIAP